MWTVGSVGQLFEVIMSYQYCLVSSTVVGTECGTCINQHMC